MKKIVCANTSTGYSMTFDHGDVIFLDDVEDIGTVSYVNTVSTNTGEDGGIIEGESQEVRHPVIRADVLSDYDAVRDMVDAVFQKGVDGKMYVYRDDGTVRMATYRVEGWELPHKGIIRQLTINLICEEPKFFDTEEKCTIMAAWTPLATFPFTFRSPFRISERQSSLMATISNPSGTTQALRIEITATGEVENPYIMDVNRRETMEIQTVLHNGDRVVATTDRNNMHIMLTRGGETSEITNLATWPISWLQLHPGTNLFRYGATSGEESLEVRIWHRRSYGGA